MAGNKDRQRRIARERHRRQQEARQIRRQQVRRRTIEWASIIAGLGLVLGLVLAFALPGSSKPATAQSTATHTSSPTPTASPTPTVVEPATHCSYTAAPAAQVAKKETFPPATPDYTTVSYLATIHTNLGPIKITLLNSKATCTVSSFVHLAQAGYFNNTQCHRMVTSGIYVLQCGDAFATASTKLTCSSSSKVGSGGPGYQYANENTTGASYVTGTVAMANAGGATNGSQFFIVFKDSTSLPANYTPFGTVSSGLNIVQNVAKDGLSCTFGTAGDGAPKQKVIIDSVTIQKT